MSAYSDRLYTQSPPYFYGSVPIIHSVAECILAKRHQTRLERAAGRKREWGIQRQYEDGRCIWLAWTRGFNFRDFIDNEIQPQEISAIFRI